MDLTSAKEVRPVVQQPQTEEERIQSLQNKLAEIDAGLGVARGTLSSTRVPESRVGV